MDAIEEAIKIRSRALGRSHPRVAVSASPVVCSDDNLKVFAHPSIFVSINRTRL